jgi:hypothetical protein
VVDAIEIDLYDSGMPGNPPQSCGSLGELGPRAGGLAQMGAFACKHGKPLSFPTAPGTRETRSRSASPTGMA